MFNIFMAFLHNLYFVGMTRVFVDSRAIFKKAPGPPRLTPSIEFCAPAENRLSVAAAIHTEPYLDQPLSVVEQVMTGDYEDGLGNVRHDPDRIHFAPLPTQAMANWILAEMKRWGYLKPDTDYARLAREVYLSTGTEGLLAEQASQQTKPIS